MSEAETSERNEADHHQLILKESRTLASADVTPRLDRSQDAIWRTRRLSMKTVSRRGPLPYSDPHFHPEPE